MNSIQEYMQKHYVISSLGVNLFLLLIPCVFGLVKYEVSDDFIMELIVSGVYGEPSSYIMFMHPLLGQILSFGYKIIHGINWYLWFQLLMIYLSFSTIGIYLLKRKNQCLFLYFWIFTFLFSLDIVQLVQFTKTATLCVIAGGFLFYEYLESKEKEKKYLIFSLLFVAVGTMIRQQCLYIGASLLFVESLIYLYIHRDNYRYYLKKESKYIFFLIIVLTGVFGYNELFLSTNHEYKEYLDFNKIRSSILDYPSPPYSFIETQLAAKGISENDYEIYKNWEFFDSDYYTTERSKEILNAVETDRGKTNQSTKEVLKGLLRRRYWNYIGFWCCLLIFIILYLYIPKSILWGVFLSCLGILTLFLNLWNGRLVYRVEFSVFLEVAASLMILSSFYETRRLKDNILSTICLSGCFLIKVLFSIPIDNQEAYRIMYVSWDNDLRKYALNFQKNNLEELKTEFKNNPENTYYLSFQSLIQTYYLSFDIFDSHKIEGFENAMYLAGVDTKNPAKNNMLKNKEIDNIAQDLLKENSYLVSVNEQDRILKYLREHLSRTLELQKITEKNGYSIWKIQ